MTTAPNEHGPQQTQLWEATVNRVMHPATAQVYRHFRYDHLPASLRELSRPCCELARQMIEALPDGPELMVGLRKLLEAKDCFVRAALP